MEYYPEKRTSAVWANNCLEILRNNHEGYYRNRQVKGRFIELIRIDDAGLYVSQNFIKIRDEYHLSFSIMFTDKNSTPHLYHPLMAGSRFDHNNTIWQQFSNDLGLFRTNSECPSGIWSSGPWYKNTMKNLEKGLSLPDEYLYPHYRSKLTHGKERLIRLFTRAAQIIQQNQLAQDVSVIEFCKVANIDPDVVENTRMEVGALNAESIAAGGKCYYGYGPKDNLFRVEDVPLESIVFHNWKALYEERERIDGIIEIASKL